MNITVGGVTYDDGPQVGLCAREKSVRTFDGSVTLTDSGRIVSGGLCPTCPHGTYMEVALYTP